MTNSNFYFNRYSKLIDNGIMSKSEVLSALINAKASLTLGSGFCQSFDDYAKTNEYASKKMKDLIECESLIKSYSKKDSNITHKQWFVDDVTEDGLCAGVIY